MDKSGTRTYTFNAAGFRGEDLDATANCRIFACGCSYTLGTRLNLEETWPHKVKLHMARHRGLDPARVNLLNFSQGAASNDYIVRTVMEQASVVKPDLVVALFTHLNRFELYDESHAFHFQPSTIERYAASPYPEMGNCGEHMFLAINDVWKAMRYIQNILLLQSYCKSRGIAMIFSVAGSIQKDHREFFECLRFPVTESLVEEIDLEAFAPLSPSMCVDRAADDFHPGVESHSKFADTFWSTYVRLQGGRA
jgi:hypothetical protein